MNNFKRRLMAFVLGAALTFGAAAPVYADGGETDNKTVTTVNDNANPSTGAYTLAGVTVILAGAAAVVFKKKK